MNFLDELDTERNRLAQLFADELGAATEDEIFAIAQHLIDAHPDGELKAIGAAIIGLANIEDAHTELQREQLAGFLDAMAEYPDDEVDSLCIDFMSNANAIKNKQSDLATQTEHCRNLLRMYQLRLNHESDLAATAENFERERERLAEFANLIVSKSAQIAPGATIGSATTQPSPQPDSALISVVIEAYCDSQKAEGKWTEKTEHENRAIHTLWLKIVGDCPIKDYSYENHRQYKSTLLKIPPNLNKNSRYRNKSIQEVIALGDPPAAPNTINKSLSRVAAFFGWAVRHGFTVFNPAGGMVIRNPKRANEERQAFSKDDLQKLFHSPEYMRHSHAHPYMHWSPLISLYTGMRINEIAQLHVADFIAVGEIQLISINGDGGEGKRLKTKAAKRLVPIHSELIRLGLLDYVEHLKQHHIVRIFPELTQQRDGYGQTVSKWFGRYRERCGVTDAGKVFHSFRHTVVDQLKQADIAKEKIAALVGHEDDSTTFGRYGKDFQPAVMQKVVETLDADITFPIERWNNSRRSRRLT